MIDEWIGALDVAVVRIEDSGRRYDVSRYEYLRRSSPAQAFHEQFVERIIRRNSERRRRVPQLRDPGAEPVSMLGGVPLVERQRELHFPPCSRGEMGVHDL